MYTEECLERYYKNNEFARVMKNGVSLDSRNYGKFTIIGRDDAKRNLIIRFDETGSIISVDPSAVKKGTIKDPNSKLHHYGVGYCGVGEYSNSTHPELYSRWCEMIRRCYDKKYQESNKSYIGCSVDESWHNFQNYARDIEELMKEKGIESLDGYAIDKDIKIRNNKIYSKETVSIVSGRDNSIESIVRNNITGEEYIAENMFDGTIFKFHSIGAFCKENGLNRQNVSNVLNGRGRSYKGFLLYKSYEKPSQYIRYSVYKNDIHDSSFLSLPKTLDYLKDNYKITDNIVFKQNTNEKSFEIDSCVKITVKKIYVH